MVRMGYSFDEFFLIFFLVGAAWGVQKHYHMGVAEHIH
jgi:hypothetical protein